MKKIINAVRIVLIAVIIAVISCCGFSQIKKIEGNWTVSDINGATPEAFFAALGYPLPSLSRNVEIGAEKIVVYSTDIDDGDTYDIKAVSGGYEVLEDGEVIGTFVYSEEKDSLTVTPFIPDAENFVFVLKRGTYNYEEN